MVQKTLAKHFKVSALALGLSLSPIPMGCRGKAFISMPEPDKKSADQEAEKQPSVSEDEITINPDLGDKPSDETMAEMPKPTDPTTDLPTNMDPPAQMDPPKEEPKKDPEPKSDPVPETPKYTFEDGDYIVKGVGSGRCMNVPSSSPTVGTTIDILDCDKRDSQIWKFQHVGDNYFRLINRWGKAIEVYSGIMNNGTALVTMEVANKNYQTFRFDKQADGSYIITVRGAEMRVNVVGSGTANGTQLQIYQDNGKTSQRWIVQKP